MSKIWKQKLETDHEQIRKKLWGKKICSPIIWRERERERERERVFKKARFRGPEHEPKKISRRSFQPPRKFKILELSVE